MEIMPKVTRRPTAKKNGTKPKKVKKEEISELGRILRKLSDEYVAKGGRLYSIEEIQREVDENRCG
jgi:hypothetical protein